MITGHRAPRLLSIHLCTLIAAAHLAVVLARIDVSAAQSAPVQPAERPIVWQEDFNAISLAAASDRPSPLPGWDLQTNADIKSAISLERAGRDGSPCLRVWSSVVDPNVTDSELTLTYDLTAAGSGPIPLTADMVLQWEWWFRDDSQSGAVSILLWLRAAKKQGASHLRSHARFWHNVPALGDRSGAWISHRLDRTSLLSRYSQLESPVMVEKIQLSLLYPMSQVLLIDNLYLGPAAMAALLPASAEPPPAKSRDYAAAIADLDADGLPDIYFPGSGQSDSRLWLSSSADPAAELAKRRGLGGPRGGVALFADFDNDGDPDLLTARADDAGPCIHENQGHGMFAEEVLCCELASPLTAVAAFTAADVDNDGDLDVYLAIPVAADVLLLNEGNLRFTAAREGCVTIEENYRTFGATFADVDGDGDQDLYASGTGLLLNNGAGRFTLRQLEWHGPRQAMAEGGALGDLDGDGNLDLYVAVDRESTLWLSPASNLLFRGDGGGNFQLVQDHAAADSNHTEAAVLADFDNDGDLDLFSGNRGAPSRGYLNEGDLRFVPASNEILPTYQGSDLEGSAAVDLDGDGDVDLLLLRGGGVPLVLVNRNGRQTFLKIRLLGTRSNWDAIGALVTVHRRSGELVARRECRAGQGFQIAGPSEVHLGLPDEGPFDVMVRFPSGFVARRLGLHGGRTVIIAESDGVLSGWYWLARRHWLPRLGAGFWRLGLGGNLLGLICLVLLFVLGLQRLRQPGVFTGRGWWRVIWPVTCGLALALWSGWFLGNPFPARWSLALVIPAGVIGGLVLPRLVHRLDASPPAFTFWDRLNDEFISYRHTNWCENLNALIRLGGMLKLDHLDAIQYDRLVARWEQTQVLYHNAVAKKLTGIGTLAQGLAETGALGRALLASLKEMNAARDGNPEQVIECTRSLLASVGALADVVDTRLSCQLTPAITAALAGSRDFLDAGEVVVQEDLVAVTGVSVRIRDHELIAILQDLFHNAVQAMATCEERVLFVRGRTDLRTATLEILDTGVGLPPLAADTLLQRGVTTSADGTGFGLYYARQMLARYLGKIQPDNRTDGAGAIVTVVLRKAKARGSAITERFAG